MAWQKPKSPVMFVKLVFSVRSRSAGMTRGNAYGCADRTEGTRTDQVMCENLVVAEQMLLLPCFQLAVLRTAGL